MNDSYTQDIFLKVPKKLTVVNAPWWKRLLALLIDILIIDTFLLFPFQSIVEKIVKIDNWNSLLNFSESSIATNNMTVLIALGIAVAIICWLYFVILESRINQTIGKIVMNIAVIKEDQKKKNEFEPLGFKAAAIRSLGVLGMTFLPFLTIADFITGLINKEKQRLLERISKTKTITKEN